MTLDSFVLFTEARNKISRLLSSKKTNLKKLIDHFFNHPAEFLSIGMKYEEMKRIIKDIISINQIWSAKYSNHNNLDFCQEISHYFDMYVRFLVHDKMQKIELIETKKIEEICYRIALLRCIDETINFPGLNLSINSMQSVNQNLVLLLVNINSKAVEIVSTLSRAKSHFNDKVLKELLSLFRFVEIMQNFENSSCTTTSLFESLHIQFIQVSYFY